jgi:DNA-binding CsgD family transcriptional regulator
MYLRDVYAKLDVHRRTDASKGFGVLGPLPGGR